MPAGTHPLAHRDTHEAPPMPGLETAPFFFSRQAPEVSVSQRINHRLMFERVGCLVENSKTSISSGMQNGEEKLEVRVYCQPHIMEKRFRNFIDCSSGGVAQFGFYKKKKKRQREVWNETDDETVLIGVSVQLDPTCGMKSHPRAYVERVSTQETEEMPRCTDKTQFVPPSTP